MMESIKSYYFDAQIYKTGINTCVDVPHEIANAIERTKGMIKIRGTINGFPFIKTLVPVKGNPYRLFINMIMLKGAKAKLGDIVRFCIEKDTDIIEINYPMPDTLLAALTSKNLSEKFDKLTAARKKDILKYMNQIKTDETRQKNIERVLSQLESGEKNVRIP